MKLFFSLPAVLFSMLAPLATAAATTDPFFTTGKHGEYTIHALLSTVKGARQGTLQLVGEDNNRNVSLSLNSEGRWLLRGGEEEWGRGELADAKDLVIKCRVSSLTLYGGTTRLMHHALEHPLLGDWFADAALREMTSEVYGQRVAGIFFADDFAREDDATGVWDDPSGAFAAVAAPQQGAAMNAFWYRGSGREPATALAGYDFWDNYSFKVALKRMDDQGDCGMVVGATENHPGWAVISRGASLQLVSRASPAVILAEVPCPLRVGQWYMFEARYSDTRLRCYVDNNLLIDKPMTTPGGRVGLLVAGTTALFDDVSVRSLSEAPENGEDPVEIPDFFKEDPYMRAWTGNLPAMTGFTIRDLFFEQQPVDWIVRQGRWQTFSRWACNPKWPFYGAPPQERALVTYKRPVQGDFTIDLFASPPMYDRRSPGYNYPLNMQIMIQPQGAPPDSGYRFVYGFHDIPSFIEAHGVSLASTSRLVTPDIRHGFGGPRSVNQLVHRLWPHVTVKRSKGKLLMLVNGTLLLEVEDRSPIEGGLVSIAAWRNGISIARLRIAGESLGETISPLSPVYDETIPRSCFTRGMDLRFVEDVSLLAPPPVAAGRFSADGASWQSDFAAGVPPWFVIRGAEGASVILKRDGTDHFARLVNTRFGGAMAVSLWRGKLPLSDKPRLGLTYRIPRWMKCNIRCQLDDNQWVEIPFLDRYQTTFPRRGQAPGRHSISEWQEIEIDLSAQLGGRRGNLRQIVLADSDHSSSYTGSFYDLKTVRLSSGSGAKINISEPRHLAKPAPFDSRGYGSILSFEDMEGDIPNITNWEFTSFMPVERHSGGHSLWIFPNRFDHVKRSVSIYSQPYKPSAYPYLHFDYRGRRSSVFLRAIVGQQEVALKELPLNPDGHWHRVVVDINRLLAKQLAKNEAPRIDRLLLGLYPNAHFEIDNVVISDGKAPE